jgi:hypothetical protein
MDSTWFPDVRPLVTRLPGELVEVRCVVAKEVARTRSYRRAVTRHEGHLDLRRTEDELWGSPSRPLGVSPIVQADTTEAVDITQLRADALAAVSAQRLGSTEHR